MRQHDVTHEKVVSNLFMGQLVGSLFEPTVQQRESLHNPLQIAQQFRSKSHTDSGVNRTVIPEQITQ